jgi:hypothetical protein
MEGVNTWLSSQEKNLFDTSIHKLIPDTNASFLAVTILRSDLSMYVPFVYNIFFPLTAFLH